MSKLLEKMSGGRVEELKQMAIDSEKRYLLVDHWYADFVLADNVLGKLSHNAWDSKFDMVTGIQYETPAEQLEAGETCFAWYLSQTGEFVRIAPKVTMVPVDDFNGVDLVGE